MAKPDLTKLLNGNEEPSSTTKDTPLQIQKVQRKKQPGEVNISAYFAPEVKSALRQVQAKTGKNIKGCLSEALTMLFRKHNVPVTVPEE